jgi:predicted ATP-grasp superfamily ATP-dependent carboligase
VSGRALVVEEGRTRGALAAVRALAGAGWTVGTGTPGARGLAGRSRYVTTRHAVPPPRDGVDAFVDAVARAVRAGGYDVVLAGGDAELLTLAAGAERVGAALPHPSYDVLVRAVDKRELSEAAQRAGLAVPRLLPPVDPLTGEAVVKPRWHWRPDRPGGTGRVEAEVVRTAEELAAAVRRMRAGGAEPLVQERVAGELQAFATVAAADGSLVGRVQQRAVRIWPPDAGVSVRAETVPVDERLAKQVGALLRDLGWRGLAEVQLIVPPGGPPHLIDLNGRLYGSLGLAVAAGVNLPAIAAALATGRRPPPDREASAGVRLHWLEGDLRAVRAAGDDRLAVLTGALRWRRDAVGSVWRGDDPRPGLAQAAFLAGRLLRKARR